MEKDELERYIGEIKDYVEKNFLQNLSEEQRLKFYRNIAIGLSIDRNGKYQIEIRAFNKKGGTPRSSGYSQAKKIISEFKKVNIKLKFITKGIFTQNIGSEIQVATLTPGTLGVYVYDSHGNLCILTCSHVLSPAGINNNEANVYLNSPKNIIATIEDHVILDPKRRNQLDAGYARVKNPDSITNINIIPSGFPFAGLKINAYPKKIDILDLMKDQKKVFKIGAGTGFSEGIITGVFDSDFRINHQYNFRNVVEVSSPDNLVKSFGALHDSGAIVFFEEENQLYALGILFSIASKYSEDNKLPLESVSYFIQIESILEYFELKLV